MPSSRFLAYLAAAAVAVSSLGKTAAAISQESFGVQGLADFPALQKLGAKDDGRLRSYLSRVSSTYRQAGYKSFARELAQASPLVVLFGQPKLAESPARLKKARAALRDLKQSLAKNSFVVLPKSGDMLPDYLGIGVAFLEGADIALKNLRAHKNVATSLRNHNGVSWVINAGSGNYVVSSSLGGSPSSFTFSRSESSSTTNSTGENVRVSFGSEEIFSSSLSWQQSIPSSGSQTMERPVDPNATPDFSSGSTINLNFSGTETISELFSSDGPFIPATTYTADQLSALYGSSGRSFTVESGVRAIFPSGVAVPAGYGTNSLYSTGVFLINGVTYPAGTRIVTIADTSAPLPEGAILLSTPATITTLPSPTPSGT